MIISARKLLPLGGRGIADPPYIFVRKDK